MTDYSLALIPETHGGIGRRRTVGADVAARTPAGSAVLLVADAGLKAAGLIDDVRQSLEAAGLGVTVFSDFTGDPTILQADAAATLARRIGARAVISMGGGSALDLGKTVAAIAADPASAEAYELCKAPLPATRLVSVVIPTTSGTGSEATRTAILTRADKAKVWLWGAEMKPDLILLDPEATASLPAMLTAQTGIDALVHALEAATNRNANAANNVYAHEAIRLARAHLPRAVSHGDDLAARDGLQRAAWLAGIAIDNGGTAVAHNIGHALASLQGLHHGRAVALGMIATLGWNVAGDDGRFAAAAGAMGLASSDDLPKAFEELTRSVGIAVALGETFAHITPAALAAQMGRPENAAMRVSNHRDIADADLLTFATTVLQQS